MTTLEATSKPQGARRIAASLLFVFATATLLIPFEQCRADTVVTRDQAEPERAMAVSGMSVWLRARFSQTELEGLRTGDLRVESYYCGCYDQPNKHYPYSIVLLKTPRGDLVARPEGTDGALSFTPLAVRYGNRYCEVGSETDCYGSFSHPCEFTDFRYGPYLAEFFPTCKSD
jgi:hypothetical protein